MARFEHKLPAVLEPVGDICVEVTIPAHPDYIALFIRAVRMLETNRLYYRDENLSAKIVVEQWRKRTITPLIEALATGTGACGVDGECLAYPPFANFISYFPQNPYTEPDLIPDGFLAPPFYVNGKDNEHDLPNYNKGDIIVDFSAINLEPSWDLDKTPRIELCLSGSGVAEIHLLNIVQGGVALISLDNPVDLGDIIAGIIDDDLKSIDLNQDIISLPPESAEEIIIEVEVLTEGDHIIYIYFLPTVNDSLIPLAFGGGLREISLCGNLRPCGTPAPEPPPPLEGVTELKPEFQFTADCGMEYRLRDQEDNIVQDWQTVPGWVENFADCLGGSMATKDDIRDGIYEAFNRLALQVASGRYTDIAVDEDGAVTDPTTEGEDAGLPEDEPTTTTINEEFAARTGGVRQAVYGLQQILDDMFNWYASFTPPSTGVTEAMAAARLVNLYQFEQVKADDFAFYWYNTYQNASLQVTLDNSNGLDALFFCRGLSPQTLAYYIYNEHITAGEVPVLESFLSCLNWQQVEDWYTQGIQVPSQLYYEYTCVPIENETLTLDMSTAEAPSKNSVQNLKQQHRYKFTTSGQFTDTDNPDLIGDFYYMHDTALGTKTFRSTNPFVSGGMNQPSASQVPWRADGVYTVIVDKTGAAGILTVSRDNAPMNLPNVTGILTIIMEDLGEYGV